MTLVSQADLFDSTRTVPAWHRAVAADLAAILAPPSAFPCTFSQNAFRRGLLRLAFVENLGPVARAKLRDDLAAYVAECRDWDGQVNSARPLLVAFSEEAAPAGDVAAYHEIGWKVLQDWHDNDPGPWPANVSRDPEHPYWSMCYAGMQLFVNMSAPAHRKRRSRNLGRHFVLVVNPRERFDIVAGDTPEGRRVRRVIRDRSAAYDGQPHAPVLGSFLAGELEWPQYALAEDNAAPLGRCPLRARPGG